MVTTFHVSSRRRPAAAAFAACAAVMLGSCSDATGVVRTSDEPFVYAVLALEPINRFSADSVVRALLLTTGSPIRSPFRTAQSFEMRRESDNAPFAWKEIPGAVEQPPVGFRGISTAEGNFTLAEARSAEGLGRRDLRAGESYALRIETDGAVVTGVVTIPAKPEPVLGQAGTRRFVAWPKVEAAASYRIVAETERFTVWSTRDTVVELLYDRGAGTPASPEFRVTAVDGNLHRYNTDWTIGSAGISGGFGVFGAVSSTARVELPRDPP